MSVSVCARNFRVLRAFSARLSGVSVLTGANGAGKTTVLLALRLLRTAYDRGLPEAVSITLGGSYNLKCHEALPDEPIELGIDVEDLSWRVRLLPRGATVDHLTEESLVRGDEIIFRRDNLGKFFFRGKTAQFAPSAYERLGIRFLAEMEATDADVAKMASVLRRFQVFYDPDLRTLRESGSRATEDRHLHANGRNVLTMLRKWRDRREDRMRFDFVNDGLRTAFPGFFDELEFDAGQTITANAYHRGDDTPHPIGQEANGFLSMLIHLADIASANDGGVVAIDEPEYALHPFAIRRFVRLARAWAERHQLSVLLTTHSPVLLDEFNADPDNVLVLERGHTEFPIALDKLRSRDWLANYSLGELYAGGDFAANEKD